MLLLSLMLLAPPSPPPPAGPWRAVLDQAGGELRFALELTPADARRPGRLCNGGSCQALNRVRTAGDSTVLEIGDYAATITVVVRGDSMVGVYRNVGNRGPRAIPFRASRGRWPALHGPAALAGSWSAWFEDATGASPRLLEFRDTPRGMEGTVIGRGGDFGTFSGGGTGDRFALSHFDGSFVYRIEGTVAGDTLRGTFHAGLRTQVPFTAVRGARPGHLPPPTAVTTADSAPFTFAFPDLDGRIVSSSDARFRGKVVLVDVFGTWCPTCHDAAPALVALYRDYHARGLEIVGLAYEVSGDSATDAPLVRSYRDKFGIQFPLLLAGTNDTDAAAATLPQLHGFGAFPTSIFLGRDGRVRTIHAGFYGPATGAQHERLVRDFRRLIEDLLKGPS